MIGHYWRRVRGFRPNAKRYLACIVFRSTTMALSLLFFAQHGFRFGL
jgi:hypothetical protein